MLLLILFLFYLAGLFTPRIKVEWKWNTRSYEQMQLCKSYTNAPSRSCATTIFPITSLAKTNLIKQNKFIIFY